MSEPFDLEVELERLVQAFETDHVPYALCGGLAMAVHGHPRATDEIEFLIEPTQIESAFSAARKAGFTLRAGPIPLGAATANLQRLFRATKVQGAEHLIIDILEVSKSYESAWRERETLGWKGERKLTVVSRTGLIAMKRLSTRLKDLADIETLEGGPNV